MGDDLCAVLERCKDSIVPDKPTGYRVSRSSSRDQPPGLGVLVGLYGIGSRFLGIGVLPEINHVRKALKVETVVSTKPLRIVFGKVFLDKKFRETY